MSKRTNITHGRIITTDLSVFENQNKKRSLSKLILMCVLYNLCPTLKSSVLSYPSLPALCPVLHTVFHLLDLPLTLQHSDRSRCHSQQVNGCANLLFSVCTFVGLVLDEKRSSPGKKTTRNATLFLNTVAGWCKKGQHFAPLCDNARCSAVISSSGFCWCRLEWTDRILSGFWNCVRVFQESWTEAAVSERKQCI